VGRVYRLGDGDWHDPGDDSGARRAFLAQGDAGFYVQVVDIPAGFEAPVHSHDHAEVFLVLDGACSFGGEPMGPLDMTVVDAHEPYGFTAGPDGLRFLIVRQGKAAYAEVDG
jgi:quercetin dioxygenase-like cupin family protein